MAPINSMAVRNAALLLTSGSENMESRKPPAPTRNTGSSQSRAR